MFLLELIWIVIQFTLFAFCFALFMSIIGIIVGVSWLTYSFGFEYVVNMIITAFKGRNE